MQEGERHPRPVAGLYSPVVMSSIRHPARASGIVDFATPQSLADGSSLFLFVFTGRTLAPQF